MAWTSERLSFLALAALVASCSGCKPNKDKGGDTGPAVARCFDLPGAKHTDLFVAEDGKSVYYIGAAKGSSGDRRDLFQRPLDTGSPKLVVSDVGYPVQPAGEGRWVFARATGGDRGPLASERQLYVFDPAGGEKAIGPAKLRHASFLVDATSRTAYVASSFQPVRKVPLSGGEGTAMTANVDWLHAIDPATKSILARKRLGGDSATCRVSLDDQGADCTPVGPDAGSFALVRGGAVFSPMNDRGVGSTPVGSRLDAAREPLTLTWAQKGDKLLTGGSAGAFVYVARSTDSGTTLLRVDVDKAETVFQSNAVELGAAVPVGTQHVVVTLIHRAAAEVDVCLVPTGAPRVTFATRGSPQTGK